VKLAVFGASGRMGRAVMRLAAEAGDVVVCAVSATDVGADAGELAGTKRSGVAIVADPAAVAGSGAEAIVDFSTPSAVPLVADAAVRARCALVSGTTGLDDAAKAALDRAARDVPVLWEPNMSVGVFVLGRLLERAIAMLGSDIDVEIVEAHHRMKADAPSGTALRLAEVARAARKDEGALVTGRTGKPGARPRSEIGVLAMRGGDVVGDHTVHLLALGERLELTHRASNRDLFARGALRAAAWLVGKPARRYTLADVLA
jgi:4-hydroxy-tetrahydrodipicolinate reductase